MFGRGDKLKRKTKWIHVHNGMNVEELNKFVKKHDATIANYNTVDVSGGKLVEFYWYEKAKKK